MLLQVKNFRFWMQAKMGQRGAAIVEYAILLAFVAIIGAAFLGAGTATGGQSMSSSITSIINTVRGLLQTADGDASAAQ